MKTNSRSRVIGRRKSKKQKRVVKTDPAATIAERYMELRRLRERISEVEARLSTR
jgi:hypothetical protein